MGWLTGRPAPASAVELELVAAQRRIRDGKDILRTLLVRLSADRQQGTGEYIDLALEIDLALDGRDQR